MGVKISELPAATALVGTELIPVMQGGETRQAAVSAFATSGHVHAATAITNTPAGTIAATTVQAALNALDTEKLATSGTAANSLRASVVDRRSTVQTPSQFGFGVDWAFMENGTDALHDGGGFHAVMHVQQWHDATGGGAYELAFTGNNNLWIRGSGTDLTSWGAWKKVIDDSAYTAADVLTKIKTVDGAASGLDADLLDGNHASAFAASSHTHSIANTTGLQTALDAKLPNTTTLTDIGADLVDADEFPVYDVSVTGNRKSLLSRVWTYISGKLTGAVSTIVTSNLTASVALVSDASGKVAVSAVSAVELGYLDGVTSAIQAQINSKQTDSMSVGCFELGVYLTGARDTYIDFHSSATPTDWDARILSYGGGATNGLASLVISAGSISIGGNTSFSGYTQLGESAPVIKMKKLTGTTSSSATGEAFVAHGLTGAKIIGIQAQLRQETNSGMPANMTAYADWNCGAWFDGTYIYVKNSGVNCVSRTFIILITYEE